MWCNIFSRLIELFGGDCECFGAFGVSDSIRTGWYDVQINLYDNLTHDQHRLFPASKVIILFRIPEQNSNKHSYTYMASSLKSNLINVILFCENVS